MIPRLIGLGLALMLVSGSLASAPAGVRFFDGETWTRRDAPWPRRVVLLVHGLDEPGFVWDELAPALAKQGLRVARFDYANDGPIPGAADRLAAALRLLRAGGVHQVDVVAHSMGGLVARDMLTRDEHYAGEGAGPADLPAIDALIMLGTPNGGSALARLQCVSEAYEQLVRSATNGCLPQRDWSRDGRGEAADDLLPGSAFLAALNRRPLPAHTNLTIVAGRCVPLSKDELGACATWIDRATDRLPPKLRRWMRERGDDAGRTVLAAVSGVGDGVVTLDSARLEGVDDIVVVEANHIDMIADPLDTGRTPPAVAIVLERLSRVE